MATPAQTLARMQLDDLRIGVVADGQRERPFVARIDDSREVDRKSLAIHRRARIEHGHQVVGDFYRLECRDKHILLRQKVEGLPLLKLNDIKVFWPVVLQGVEYFDVIELE